MTLPEQRVADSSHAAVSRLANSGAALTVVLLAGAVLLWRLDSVPRQVHGDEWTFSFAAWEFYRDPTADWFAVRGFIMGPFYAVLGLVPYLFGYNILTARLSDALLGIAAVALLYNALRLTCTVRLATVAALLLAVNHCHIAYARTAIGYVQTEFVVTLLFNLLVRLWTAPTALGAVGLGMGAAVGMQTALASMAAVPLLIVTVALLLLMHPAHRGPLRAPLCIAAVTFFAAAAPCWVAMWQQGDEFFARAHQVSILSPGVMRSAQQYYQTDSAPRVFALQMWNALTAFHRGHDAQPAYGVEAPMADPYTAALLIPGLLFSLWRLRNIVTLSALTFGAGYLVSGLGMNYAPAYQRALGGVPFAMTIAAIGLVQLVETACPRPRWLANGLLTAVVALCAYGNFQIYFVNCYTTLLTGDVDSEAGWAARELAPAYHVHLVDWFAPGSESTRFITAGVPVSFNPLRDAVAYVNTVSVTGHDVFILNGDDAAARNALVARFPTARVETRRRHAVYGPSLFLAFVDAQQPS